MPCLLFNLEHMYRMAGNLVGIKFGDFGQDVIFFHLASLNLATQHLNPEM